MTNYFALGLYCYIASLAPGWEFHKDQLAKHGNIGRDKINSILKILEDHCLIKCVQIRDSKGKFSHFDLQVDDGTSFKIIELEKLSTPFTEKPLTANQLLDIRTYKRNNKKENKETKKRESPKALRASLAPLPDDFVFDERVEQRANEKAMAIGISLKDLRDKFKAYAKERGLKSADWNASFQKFVIDERSASPGMATKKTPITATGVPLWGPGHPTWDSLNAWDKQHA